MAIKKKSFKDIKSKFSKKASFKPDRFLDLGEAFLDASGIPGPAMSILPAVNWQTAQGSSLHPSNPGPMYIFDGNFQMYMGGPTVYGPGPFTYAGNNYPPLNGVIPTGRSVQFSQPLYYYFGLRPGATSFNTFVRKYIDEELADTVL